MRFLHFLLSRLGPCNSHVSSPEATNLVPRLFHYFVTLPLSILTMFILHFSLIILSCSISRVLSLCNSLFLAYPCLTRVWLSCLATLATHPSEHLQTDRFKFSSSSFLFVNIALKYYPQNYKFCCKSYKQL